MPDQTPLSKELIDCPACGGSGRVYYSDDEGESMAPCGQCNGGGMLGFVPAPSDRLSTALAEARKDTLAKVREGWDQSWDGEFRRGYKHVLAISPAEHFDHAINYAQSVPASSPSSEVRHAE